MNGEDMTDQEARDEREALEDWSFKHRPILSMRDGSIASCKCMDRVFYNGREDWDSHIADSLIAAGWKHPEPEVTDTEREARALEAAANQVDSHYPTDLWPPVTDEQLRALHKFARSIGLPDGSRFHVAGIRHAARLVRAEAARLREDALTTTLEPQENTDA